MKIKVKNLIELIGNLRHINTDYSKGLIEEIEESIGNRSIHEELSIKIESIDSPFVVVYEDSETVL